MSRVIKQGSPRLKNARGNPSHDHSPDDRRHAHPAHEVGMDAERRVERHHRKR